MGNKRTVKTKFKSALDERILMFMEKKGITDKELSRRMERNTYYMRQFLKSGSTPKYFTMNDIAIGLDISIVELMPVNWRELLVEDLKALRDELGMM